MVKKNLYINGKATTNKKKIYDKKKNKCEKLYLQKRNEYKLHDSDRNFQLFFLFSIVCENLL